MILQPPHPSDFSDLESATSENITFPTDFYYMMKEKDINKRNLCR